DLLVDNYRQVAPYLRKAGNLPVLGLLDGQGTLEIQLEQEGRICKVEFPHQGGVQFPYPTHGLLPSPEARAATRMQAGQGGGLEPEHAVGPGARQQSLEVSLDVEEIHRRAHVARQAPLLR